MGKNLEAKCKQCRRAQEKLFFKGDRCKSQKCAMVKRNYPPGFHGPTKRKVRLTDYGTQLNEKQKGRKQYLLMEKQFRLTFDKALRKPGNTGEVFLQLLETRFDNTIYRSGLSVSRAQARQLVNHGLFTINDKKVNIPSYQLRIGDVIKIKSNKKNAKIFKDLAEKLKNHEAPGWMNVDNKEISVKILHKPTMEAIQPSFNVQMIIEYYSR